MGCALYGMLGLDCWSGPRCADCPTAEWAGSEDPVREEESSEEPKGE